MKARRLSRGREADMAKKSLFLQAVQHGQRLRRVTRSKVCLKAVLAGIPFVWGILFFFVPTLLVLKISLAKSCFALPPFTSFIQKIDHCFYNIYLYLGNYKALFTDSFYFSAVLSSVWMAGVTTAFALLIGYAMAYAISRTPKRLHTILILLIVLPFATSFLVRVYSWMTVLNSRGIINVLLMKLGLISAPLHFLDNNYAVCLGMVYCYLPFMILPIYAVLEKIDRSLIEASLDLGANRFRSFWTVTVPLSLPGVFAGCTLVFVPALGEFVIPELLGGAKTMTIGQTIWCEFFNNRDWPLACAIAVLMMFSFTFYALSSRIKKSFLKGKDEEKRKMQVI